MPFQYPQTDAHVHPDFSIDAKGSLADYCERALEIGLHEIIFTTHIDTNGKYPDENQMVVDGKRIDISAEGIKRYAEEVWKAKEKYYDIGLMVKCGVEVDFYPGIDEKFLRIFEDRLFEYKLAGIHRIWDYCIGYENETLQLFADKDVNEILREYYSTVKSVAEMKFFDTIAHLDYYRRFAPVEKRNELLVSDFDFVHEALDSMVENAIGLEVNTSALRHGHKEYYPAMPLLNLARKHHVQIRYLGSDAHCPEQLALDFENAEMIVYETNVYDPLEG